VTRAVATSPGTRATPTPPGHLRPRQRAAYQAVFDHLAKGIDSMLVALPTGVGKTHLALAVARAFERVLFLVHRGELLQQGTVGAGPSYRVTEWHTLNEYQDIVLDSLVVIDAPEGANAMTRVQQALTSARGAGELNGDGLLTWEIGSKTVTLQATSDAARATLHVTDSYQLPEVMQVYNRR